MGKISGITVNLQIKTKTGVDSFGAPVYTSIYEDVPNVLVQPATAEDVINSVQLYGKHAAYNIAIPKGDTHVWEDVDVSFFGQTFHTFGPVTEGIEELIPLQWNRKIKCEIYE